MGDMKKTTGFSGADTPAVESPIIIRTLPAIKFCFDLEQPWAAGRVGHTGALTIRRDAFAGLSDETSIHSACFPEKSRPGKAGRFRFVRQVRSIPSVPQMRLSLTLNCKNQRGYCQEIQLCGIGKKRPFSGGFFSLAEGQSKKKRDADGIKPGWRSSKWLSKPQFSCHLRSTIFILQFIPH